MGCGASGPAGASADQPVVRPPSLRTGSARPSSSGLSAQLATPNPSQSRRPSSAIARRDDAPLAAVSKGISLRALHSLKDRISAALGERYADVTTAQVVEEWVRPATLQYKCRVAEHAGLVDPADVGVPTYFASHPWSNSFAVLMRDLEGFMATAAESARVWLDIFAVNQHDDTPYQAKDVAAFKEVVRAATGGTVVVVDIARANPATRAWCLCEWSAALAEHGPEALHLRISAEVRASIVGAIDVAAAECSSAADKDAILRDIVDDYGSADEFNERLKLQLMLEPDSHRVDLRRLMSRAQDTEWVTGPLQGWLAAPERPGGGSRAMCLMSGPGEGKSTIAAALLQLEETRDAISAYHFLKFSDQRRLDPVRIIKGLALQLATGFPALRPSLLERDVVEVATLTDPKRAFAMLLMRPIKQAFMAAPGGGGGASLGRYLSQHDMMEVGSAIGSQPPSTYAQSSAFDADSEHITEDALEQSEMDDDDDDDLGLYEEGRGGSSSEEEGAGGGGGGGRGGVWSGPPIVILIDGLDEGDPLPGLVDLTPPGSEGGSGKAGGSLFCGNKALQLLVKQLVLLPPQIRFIITTRPEAVNGKVRLTLDRVFQGQGQGGVTYINPQQLRNDMARAAAAVAAGRKMNVGSVLMYNTVAAECLPPRPPEAKHAVLRRVGSSSVVADLSGLYDAYSQVFKNAVHTLQPASKKQAVEELLQVLLVAREPLPRGLLERMGFGEVLPLLPGWPVLFFEDHNHVYILHKTLADWLLDHHASGHFSVNIAQGHFLLAKRLLEDRPGAGNRVPPYSLKYLMHHLSAARELAAIEDLLFSFDFVHQVFRHGYGPGLIRDLLLLDSPTPLATDALRWLQSQQHELQGAESPSEVATNALCSPTASLAFKAAEERAAVSLSGRPHRWRLNGAHGEDRTWPPDKLAVNLAGRSVTVVGLSYSPDGRYLAGCMSGEVCVWEAATLQLVTKLKGHRGMVLVTAFSSDGAQLASGGADTTVRLYDSATGDCMAVLGSHKRRVTAIAFSADGRFIATAGRDRRVLIWDLSLILSGAFSSSSSARRPSTVTPRVGSRLPSTASRLASNLNAALSPPVIGASGIAHTLRGHRRGVLVLAFSPDSRRLASGSGDMTVRLWDVHKGECLAVLIGHDDFVQNVVFTHDGRRMVTCCGGAYTRDYTVRMWEVSNGRQVDAVIGVDELGQPVAVGHGGQLLALRYGETVGIWNVAAGRITAEAGGHTYDTLGGVAFSPDGTTFVTSVYKAVRAFDTVMAGATFQADTARRPARTRRRGDDDEDDDDDDDDGDVDDVDAVALGADGAAQKPQAHTTPINCVAYNGNGRRMATAGMDGMVCVWDANALQCSASWQAHDGAAYGVAFSPDGRRIASGGQDEVVRWWDADGRGNCLATRMAKTGIVSSVAYSPDGRFLAAASGGYSDSGTYAGIITLYDNFTCEPVTTCTVADAAADVRARRLAFSPHGRLLASAHSDGNVRLWEMQPPPPTAPRRKANDPKQPAPPPAPPPPCIAVLAGTSMAFSPDGASVVTGGDMLRMWDANTRKEISTLPIDGTDGVVDGGSEAVVDCLVWSPNGRYMAGASSANDVRIWDVATGECLAFLHARSAIYGIAFRPDTKQLACCTHGQQGLGALLVWAELS